MKYAKASSGEFPTLDGNTEWNRCVTVKKTVIPTNLILNVRLVGIMANNGLELSKQAQKLMIKMFLNSYACLVIR